MWDEWDCAEALLASFSNLAFETDLAKAKLEVKNSHSLKKQKQFSLSERTKEIQLVKLQKGSSKNRENG